MRLLNLSVNTTAFLLQSSEFGTEDMLRGQLSFVTESLVRVPIDSVQQLLLSKRAELALISGGTLSRLEETRLMRSLLIELVTETANEFERLCAIRETGDQSPIAKGIRKE
jgi:hypothetical protein